MVRADGELADPRARARDKLLGDVDATEQKSTRRNASGGPAARAAATARSL
jgi:hypothetical protein